METVEQTVARNVAEVRELRRHTVRSLSARLEELGHPILASGISKIENGARRVDVSDLVALALALEVTPNRLLLPSGDEPGAPAVLAPKVVVTQRYAWDWADGSNTPTPGSASARPDIGAGDHNWHSRPGYERAGFEYNIRGALGALLGQIRLIEKATDRAQRADGKPFMNLRELISVITQLPLRLLYLDSKVNSAVASALDSTRAALDSYEDSYLRPAAAAERALAAADADAQAAHAAAQAVSDLAEQAAAAEPDDGELQARRQETQAALAQLREQCIRIQDELFAAAVYRRELDYAVEAKALIHEVAEGIRARRPSILGAAEQAGVAPETHTWLRAMKD